jgi:hypothetical protein
MKNFKNKIIPSAVSFMVTFSVKNMHIKYVKNTGNTRWTNGCATKKYGKIDEKILGRLYKKKGIIMESVDIDNKALLC